MDIEERRPKSRISKWLQSTRDWIDEHRLASIIIASAIGIAVIGNIAYALLNAPMVHPVSDIVVKKKEEKFYAPLTGLQIKSKKAATKPVTAVIIENSPDARPQSGLKQAEVVYEAIAEGGITRFMVLYQQNSPKKIGPVRSIRPYFVEWYTPYDASMVHVGGSAKALKMIRNGDYRDLDQFFNPGAFWRATDRFAPHNVYTTGAKLAALNKQKGYKKSKPAVFEREDSKPAKKPTATRISVKVGSSDLFNSTYRYSKKQNYYVRSQGGAQHKDQQKGIITPSVIIAMEVQESTEFQDTNREVIKTTGSGKATIFQNGKAIKVTWHRKSQAAQLTFTDKKGESVPLARGQTWITAVPSGRGDISWQ